MDLHELASAQLTADMGASHFWEAGARAMYKDSRRDQTALRAISRLIVEAARPRRRAIMRTERPATSPRDISSRSTKLNANRERLRTGGVKPPVDLM